MRSQLIPIPGHKHELVPRGGPVIWNIQEKGTAVEVRRKM